MALAKENRLIRKKDFDRVFASGESFSVGPWGVKFLKNEGPASRIGVTIPARVFARAVDRNRAKRIISAAVRNILTTFPYSVDLVIIVKPGFDLDRGYSTEAQKIAERLSRLS